MEMTKSSGAYGSHLQLRLRLAFLLIAVSCTLLAWFAYHTKIVHYDMQIEPADVRKRLDKIEADLWRAKSRLQRLRHEQSQLASGRRSSAYAAEIKRCLPEVAYLEEERAIAQLELLGFEVDRRGPAPKIAISRRSLGDDELPKLLQCLAVVDQHYGSAVVDFNGAKLSDAGRVVRDVRAACPACEVKQ
jgi:hypothetical protein